ncbi:MAG: ArsR/SmtB family transcription factor, partial [Rudaea sp.]
MTAHADTASRLLKSLANAQRLRILCLLVTGERSVGALNDQLDLSQSALSQHLARLREDGLVTTRREAQTIHYRLASGPAQRLIKTLHGIYC